MPNTSKKLPEKGNLTFPVVRYFIWKIQFLSNILSMIALTDFGPISNKYFFGGAVDTRGKPLLEGCSLFSSECETMLYLRKYGILNLRIIIFPRKKLLFYLVLIFGYVAEGHLEPWQTSLTKLFWDSLC